MTETNMNRRQLLAAGSIIGGAATAAACGCGDAAWALGKRGKIDVHHHVLPPNAPPQLKALMPDWSPQAALDGMDAAGIETGIAWAGAPRVPDPAKQRLVVRGMNEFTAKLGHDHPGRFGLFAALPMQDVPGTLAEIDFALNELHADGFGITTSYGDLWLGDASFWPIYEKLNAVNAVVFVHPTDAACCAPQSMTYMRAMMDGSWIEWPMNTARTILSLMVTGTLRKYPNIRFIFAHGGGVMPLLVNRIAGLAAWKHVGPEGLASLIPDGVESEFARLHFECAQAATHPNMDALRTLVPDTNILYGSDYPFFPLQFGAEKFAELKLPEPTAYAIGRGNAEKMMPRWA